MDHPQDYIHLIADGEDDTLFIDTAYMEYIPSQQAAPIVRWTAQTRIRVDYGCRRKLPILLQRCGRHISERTNEGHDKKKMEEKISARLKSLTPTNDDLLKTLSTNWSTRAAPTLREAPTWRNGTRPTFPERPIAWPSMSAPGAWTGLFAMTPLVGETPHGHTHARRELRAAQRVRLLAVAW